MPDTSRMVQDEVMTVHAAAARALHELGVETLFGLMGDSNLFLVDAYVRNHSGRYVAATHEANGVMMALGHAAMTGDVGVATITHGPALSNAVTPLIEGVKGMLPLVLLAGDTPQGDPDHPQTVAQRALIEATGSGYARLRAPETVATDVAAAVRRARVERRPIVLNLPTELMWDTCRYRPVIPVPDHAPVAPMDSPALEDAVGMIAAARRPLVLAGRGAVPARDTLLRLAKRIGAPIATTLKAKGLFAEEPYDIGVFGTLSTPAASEVIAETDCVVAFGAGLNRFTAAKGAWFEGRRLIQVDEDARQLGRLATPQAMVHGNPGLVADRMIAWLDAAEVPSSRAVDTLDRDALAAPLPLPKVRGAEGTADLSLALHQIDAALPGDKIFVSDGGRFLQEAWTRVRVSHPRNMLLSTNTGAVGMGTGHAIGASVARPDQTVLLVTGDGGFMMGGLAEFATAVREKLDLVVLVCNDNAYGAEYVHFEDRQMDPSLCLFNWPSFAEAAAALGGTGVRVTSEAELSDALTALETRTTPLLIELVLDPAAVPRLHF